MQWGDDAIIPPRENVRLEEAEFTKTCKPKPEHIEELEKLHAWDYFRQCRGYTIIDDTVDERERNS